jgi:hypothetical protein
MVAQTIKYVEEPRIPWNSGIIGSKTDMYKS